MAIPNIETLDCESSVQSAAVVTRRCPKYPKNANRIGAPSESHRINHVNSQGTDRIGDPNIETLDCESSARSQAVVTRRYPKYPKNANRIGAPSKSHRINHVNSQGTDRIGDPNIETLDCESSARSQAVVTRRYLKLQLYKHIVLLSRTKSTPGHQFQSHQNAISRWQRNKRLTRYQ